MKQQLYIILVSYKGKNKDLSRDFENVIMDHPPMSAIITKYSNVKGAKVLKR